MSYTKKIHFLSEGKARCDAYVVRKNIRYADSLNKVTCLRCRIQMTDMTGKKAKFNRKMSTDLMKLKEYMGWLEPTVPTPP